MAVYAEQLLTAPEDHRGRWRQAFPFVAPVVAPVVAPGAGHSGCGDESGDDCGGRRSGDTRRLFVEIGTGKGDFILTAAQQNPSILYLGIEGSENALYRALQKTEGVVLPNLRFCATYVLRVQDLFGDGELSGLYLNFSDPWPKARHAKRRLTAPAYLRGYGAAIEPGGFLQFKTDNDAFFAYTKEMMEEASDLFTVEASTEDLWHSPYADGNIKTEYEGKFLKLQKTINYLRALRK
jgi:tRNA (guanine-N7-)-methyltransferase